MVHLHLMAVPAQRAPSPQEPADQFLVAVGALVRGLGVGFQRPVDLLVPPAS